MISELAPLAPYAPYVLTGAPATAATVAAGRLVHGLGLGMPYWRAESPELRANIRTAARIRRTWDRTAQRLGLYLEDRTPTLADRWNGRAKSAQARIVIPRILRCDPDQYGVTVILRTVEKVDLAAVRKQSEHLRNVWRARRLSIEEVEPGILRLRAINTDPLTLDVVAGVPEQPATLTEMALGLDRDGVMQSLPIANGAACTVGGNPGFGKSAFARGLVTQWAPHPHVQLIGANGKAPLPLVGDFRPLAPRFSSLLGSDVDLVRVQMRQLLGEMVRRYTVMWDERGSDDFWSKGPSLEWPVILAIYDECHVFLSDPEIADIAEKLSRLCRAAGIYMFWLTQKLTANAIPTMIRDVATEAVLFPVRSGAAAVAGLGDEIHEFPDDNPRKLLNPRYRGVGTIKHLERDGFTQFKSPFTPVDLAEQVCARTAHFTRDIPGVTVGVSHRPGKADVMPDVMPAVPAKVNGRYTDRDKDKAQGRGRRGPSVRPGDFLPGESLGRRGAKRRADGEAAG